MKQIILTFTFMALLYQNNLQANVGVFTGYGHSIELTKTKDIQMMSEDVTIIPGRGRFLFNGGVPGMDRVEYDCIFVLKNLKDKKVSIQVGFPLNTQFLNPPYNKKQKTSDLVVRYNFIAQEEGHQYTVDYVAGDKKKNLKNLFLWKMDFKENETKTLRVTYSMPISMTLASTELNMKDSKYQKEWYKALEGCMLEIFGYVTETGKSWSGPIKKATFKVYIEGFEKYIYNRPLMEGINDKEKTKTQEKFPVWKPTIFRFTDIEDWKKNDKGFLELSYENYKADKNIIFYYYILSFPQTIDDVKRLIAKLSKKGFSDEDYRDLVDIFKEYNGIKTKNKRIHRFLKNQKWYGKKVQQLIPEEVLNSIKK